MIGDIVMDYTFDHSWASLNQILTGQRYPLTAFQNFTASNVNH
jgi:hypothetical protein